MKFPLLRLSVLALSGFLACGGAMAQSDAEQLAPILAQSIQTPDVTAYQLRQYLMGRVAPLPAPASASEWTAEAKRIRRHLLDDVVFHGWPADWVNAPPKFEEAGVIEGNGYRIRKFRYEIVPGFQSAALLYEPDHLAGKMPAILNVNGHVGPLGKAIEYKQKRCINYAKHGILALSLEWLAFGELTAPENDHAFAAHLDLVGMNGVGLFYLGMRRCRHTGYRQGRVQNEKLARPAAESVVSLRHWFLGEAPLPHVVHYSDDLAPGAVVATMREHPSKRVLIRPEETGHALINHARIDDGVGLIRGWLAVALIERAEAHIERLGRLNVCGCQ